MQTYVSRIRFKILRASNKILKMRNDSSMFRVNIYKTIYRMKWILMIVNRMLLKSATYQKPLSLPPGGEHFLLLSYT